MRKVLFAVFVVHVLHAVARVPAETAIYGEILTRAQQRKQVAPGAAVEDKKVNRRKFSAQQAQLLRDVTLSFRPSMPTAEKYEYFERLMSDLEMREEILSISRFKEFSGVVRRHFRPKERGWSCFSNGKIPKVGVEVSAILSDIFQENASLTATQVFEVLKRNGVVPLPSKTDLHYWLKYRRKELAFLSLLGGVNDSHEDISPLLSVLSTENLVSGECPQSDAPPADLPPAKKTKFTRDSIDPEKYNELLLRARQRNGEKQMSRFENHKFSLEHRELLADVVKTCQEDLDVCKQYEVFRKLISDLQLGEISSTLFHYSANCLLREKKPAMGDRMVQA